MKTLFLLLSFVVLGFTTSAQSTYVRFVTNKGDITVMLYDGTPKHRDMFLNSIKSGVYKNSTFNRVIKSFVSQGGELDDTILNREKRHPEKIVSRFPAEIKIQYFHKKGALGAGRDDNPEKASYFSQLYLVAGKKQSDAQLDAIEQKKGRKIPVDQREIYRTIGGVPHLDGDYTVFGEIVEGMEVADAINAISTDKDDVPVMAVVFTPVVLSKREAAKLRKFLR